MNVIFTSIYQIDKFMLQYSTKLLVLLTEFFWSVFSRMRTECGDLQSKSINSVQIWENTDQKEFQIGTIFTQRQCRYLDYRSCNWRSSVKRGVLKNFTGKDLCQSRFLITLQAFSLATLLKRNSNAGVFCEIYEIFKNTYFEEHLRMTASMIAFYLFFFF